jgi:Holliday junction resolvase RusA-like endonuclease
VRYAGPVSVTLHIFYASERPDLDESVVLDVLQDRYKTVEQDGEKVRVLVQRGVYVNDRQVREKHVFHGIDRANPRTVVQILPLQPQQVELALPVRVADPVEV